MKPAAKNFSNLLAEVLVAEDMALLEEELRVLANSGSSDLSGLDIRPRIGQAFKEDLKIYEGGLKEYCQEVLVLLKNLKVVELTLAFEPTPAIVKRLVEKVRDLAKQEVVLSLVINPAIVGGCLIAHQGEFRDYSVSAKLLTLLNESVGAG